MQGAGPGWKDKGEDKVLHGGNDRSHHARPVHRSRGGQMARDGQMAPFNA